MFLKHIWIIYIDGKPGIWCTSKKSAEGYRCWSRRKLRNKINIVRYEICEPHKSKRLWPTDKPVPRMWK